VRSLKALLLRLAGGCTRASLQLLDLLLAATLQLPRTGPPPLLARLAQRWLREHSGDTKMRGSEGGAEEEEEEGESVGGVPSLLQRNRKRTWASVRGGLGFVPCARAPPPAPKRPMPFHSQRTHATGLRVRRNTGWCRDSQRRILSKSWERVTSPTEL
jgi:hypothetical protein